MSYALSFASSLGTHLNWRGELHDTNQDCQEHKFQTDRKSF